MVTLSSWPIRQIISFILPPNEYGCVYASLGGLAIDLQKMPILAKKINFSDEAKRWSKIVAFRTQKTHTHTLKSRRTQNESLFGTHHWAIFLWKWARRGRCSQWRSLSRHVERIFVHKNWRRENWQHLVSTVRRYVPHSRSYTRCFVSCFWRSHYQPQSWCRLATSELRFDSVDLLFVACSQRKVLRRQARDNWRFKGQYSWSHWCTQSIMCLKIVPIV